MNDTTKKVVLVVIIVLAVIAVAFTGKQMVQGDQMVIQNHMDAPAGHKSEKEAALAGQSGPQSEAEKSALLDGSAPGAPGGSDGK